MSWTVLAAAVLIYLIILILLRVNEARLIYFPGPERTLVVPPPSLGLPVERVELTTDDAVKLVGWAIRASPPSPWWLLICHGNAGNLSEFGRPAHYAGLRRLGLNLLAFDYRGYGESRGVPTEAGLYRDADAAYRYLVQQLRVPPESIILFGHSLGSAVAIDLASRVRSAGLIVEGAFTSATDRGQELYPFIPVRWVAASRFNSREKITRVTVAKLFLHASGDEVIPLSHGRRLYQAAEPPKSIVELQGGHGDTFDVDSASYYGAITAFLASLQPGPQPR